MPHNITNATIIVGKNNNLPTTILDDELIMMDIEKGNYINLNKTGNIIWQYIEPPISVEDIIQKLVEKYNIDADVCTSDTIQYLEHMHTIGLIQIA
ncbi:PqqD family peptide modification chaperone [Emticicia fontis]